MGTDVSGTTYINSTAILKPFCFVQVTFVIVALNAFFTTVKNVVFKRNYLLKEKRLLEKSQNNINIFLYK